MSIKIYVQNVMIIFDCSERIITISRKALLKKTNKIIYHINNYITLWTIDLFFVYFVKLIKEITLNSLQLRRKIEQVTRKRVHVECFSILRENKK